MVRQKTKRLAFLFGVIVLVLIIGRITNKKPSIAYINDGAIQWNDIEYAEIYVDGCAVPPTFIVDDSREIKKLVDSIMDTSGYRRISPEWQLEGLCNIWIKFSNGVCVGTYEDVNQGYVDLELRTTGGPFYELPQEFRETILELIEENKENEKKEDQKDINAEAVDSMILGKELSERYMSRADFLGFRVEELRLIRNGIYAKNGAIFQSEDLNTYFVSKPWYRGEVPVSEFPEELISDVERANLELLKKMEAAAEEHEEARKVVANLPEAPYLQYLDQYRETGMEADMNFAEDMGNYYVVPGTIKHPVTFTEEQRQAMENGEEITIVVDEVSGETKMIRKHPDSAPDANVYLWHDKETELNDDTEIVNAWLNMESGVHTLWRDSDDTIMKNVYKGNLFILKGAGTGAHVSLEMASEDQREIRIPDSNTYARETSVFGNYLFHDGRGYFTAVYYLGD